MPDEKRYPGFREFDFFNRPKRVQRQRLGTLPSTRKACQTDFSDAERSYTEPHIPALNPSEQHSVNAHRQVLNGIVYIVRAVLGAYCRTTLPANGTSLL